MKKIQDFYKKNKHAVIWTACYITTVFFVLILLFGFNIFSMTDWSRLWSAELRGFPGFVFGILMLAALPLYVATTRIIVRTGKPLFVLVPAKEVKKEEKKEVAAVAETAKPLPAGIPTELRGAFMRARHNIGTRETSAFESKDPAPIATPESVKAPEPVGLPIPDNFDFGMAEPATPTAPTFKTIDFGSPKNESVEPKKETAPVPNLAEFESTELHKYLTEKKYDIAHDGNIIIANGMAIATHNDSDFWIADGDNWFAAGKQKESPVALALAAAAKHNVEPAIYLAENNIMDLENQTAEWEKQGIRVVKKLSDI